MIRRRTIMLSTFAAAVTCVLYVTSIWALPSVTFGGADQGWLISLESDGGKFVGHLVTKRGPAPSGTRGSRMTAAKGWWTADFTLTDDQNVMVAPGFSFLGLTLTGIDYAGRVDMEFDETMHLFTGLTRSREFEIPIWMPLVFLLAVPALAVYRGPILRSWRKRKGNLCLACGYNLKGNVTGKCSECGTEIEGDK